MDFLKIQCTFMIKNKYINDDSLNIKSKYDVLQK